MLSILLICRGSSTFRHGSVTDGRHSLVIHTPRVPAVPSSIIYQSRVCFGYVSIFVAHLWHSRYREILVGSCRWKNVLLFSLIKKLDTNPINYNCHIFNLKFIKPNFCAIALDDDKLKAIKFNYCTSFFSTHRYIAVTQPIKYAKHKSNGRVWSMIGVAWLVSGAIGSPVVLGLNNTPDRSPDQCLFNNTDYVIYSSLGSFYMPCIIMMFLYYNIFKVSFFYVNLL